MYHNAAPEKKESRHQKSNKYFIDLASSDFNVESAKGLRWYFTKFVFLVLLGSSIMVALLTILLENIGLLTRFRIGLPVLIIGIYGASLIFGAIITVSISKYVLRPINTLSSAMKKVAGGDFSVKLNENVTTAFIHQLNADFNHMVHELSTVGTLRNDFVSNVSHEFKTPLAAIEGYAVLLQDDTLSVEDRKEYTERILCSSRRLSTLVANILAISKIDNETMPLPHSVYRIDEQIRRNILSLEPKWSSKNIPAISEETMKHMFEKFYQGDTSHKSEGNGLGLTLVKKIISLHGGSISVRNTSDGLVEFNVIIPNNSFNPDTTISQNTP